MCWGSRMLETRRTCPFCHRGKRWSRCKCQVSVNVDQRGSIDLLLKVACPLPCAGSIGFTEIHLLSGKLSHRTRSAFGNKAVTSIVVSVDVEVRKVRSRWLPLSVGADNPRDCMYLIYNNVTAERICKKLQGLDHSELMVTLIRVSAEL